MATLAIGTVASAAATATGLGLGAKDLNLTSDLFKLQMRQAKRLWAADWAEGSWRHGESMLQSAKQHAEGQAMGAAAYFQAEKHHRAEFRQSADMDARAFEMSWRAEVREALRDELANLNNRFNNVMLCDTVCLGCAFSIIADGEPPQETSTLMLSLYLLSLGVSIMMFTTSLWASVIIVRRLNESTASTLERKLYFSNETLQGLWKQQLDNDQPTGTEIMIALAKAYEAWVDENCEPMGSRATTMLSSGVVSLFVTAGLLTHAKYTLEFEARANTAVALFWACVVVTVSTVVYMQMREDRREKRKEGPYDSAWQDAAQIRHSKRDTGQPQQGGEAEDLYAKVTRAGQRLQSAMQVPGYGTADDVAASAQREEEERAECAAPNALRENWELLRQQSAERRAIREEVVQMLTAAGIKEEREALPEELTTQLNKILYNVEAIDSQTQEAVEQDSAAMTETPELPPPAAAARAHALAATSSAAAAADTAGAADAMTRTQSHSQRLAAPALPSLAPMVGPVDSANSPVHLPEVRYKLGDISRTTLLRLRNESTEILRCVAGRVLESGMWIESMEVQQQQQQQQQQQRGSGGMMSGGTTMMNSSGKLELLPPDQIPPRTEVVIAARSTGSLVPTSGVEGRLLYASQRDESWTFEIDFKNLLVSSKRSVRVQASQSGGGGGGGDEMRRTATTAVVWEMKKNELDRKENNEVIVTISQVKGQEAWELRSMQAEANRVIKQGTLWKNSPSGFQLRWQKRWFKLTGEELQYFENKASRQCSGAIALSDITRLVPTEDVLEDNVFDLELQASYNREPYRLSAEDRQQQREWMRAIQDTMQHRVSRTTMMQQQRTAARGEGSGAQTGAAAAAAAGGGGGGGGGGFLAGGQHVAPARGSGSAFAYSPEPEPEPAAVASGAGAVLSRGSSALSQSSASLRDAFSLSQSSGRSSAVAQQQQQQQQQPAVELRSSLLGVQAGRMSEHGGGGGASAGGFVVDEPDDTI
jgi:hypothetical protein